MKNNKNPVGADAHIRPDPEKDPKNQTGITLIALIVTIIVLLILAGVSLSLVAGGNGIIEKAANAVNETNEKTAIEEVELAISEANMQYYLDDTVTNETLAQYLARKFSSYTTGSGAQITFNEDGTIQYEGANGDFISLEMNENGKVEVTAKADGSKITKTVTYDANGGTGNVPATQTVERKATVNVDFSALPTREGYQFLGWATTNNATSAQYRESGTKTFSMGTSNVTLYAVWGRPAVTAISSVNYGDEVNYISNGVSDWKIFYNDGSYIYLITSDYLQAEKVPTDKTGLSVSDVCRAYWLISNVPSLQASWKEYSTSFMAKWELRDNYNSDKCASALLNTNNWSMFANGTSGFNDITDAVAIGSPTLEMWVQSWNAKGYTELGLSSNGHGYTVGLASAGKANYYDLSNEAGFADKLYFPYPNVWTPAARYWLASPSGWAPNCLANVLCTGMIGNNDVGINTEPSAIRPLIRLPAGIMTIKGNDGKWTFAQ